MNEIEGTKKWNLLVAVFLSAMVMVCAVLVVKNLSVPTGDEDVARLNRVFEESNHQLKSIADTLQTAIESEREDFAKQKLEIERVLDEVKQFVDDSNEVMKGQSEEDSLENAHG